MSGVRPINGGQGNPDGVRRCVSGGESSPKVVCMGWFSLLSFLGGKQNLSVKIWNSAYKLNIEIQVQI